MTDKFTKGPWKLEQEATWPFGLWTKATDGTVIACDDLASYSTGDTLEKANAREGNAERIANAKLRAAAPPLLEALEKTLDAYIGASKDFMAVDAKMEGHELATFMDDDATVVQARAAIASARGEA